MDNLWTRRAQTSSKLSLSTGNAATNGASNDQSSRNYTLGRKTADSSSHSNKNPFNSVAASIASPTSASSAFGLGTGAFASFGASKAPKTPGTALDFGALGMGSKSSTAKEPAKDVDQVEGKLAKITVAESQTATLALSEPSAPRTTVDTWVFWCRPPMQKNNGYAVKYEDTISSMAKFNTDLDFVAIFGYLKHPSEMPIVWEYHLFKEGIRPIWEDEENRKGGKWVIRLAKGVADRCWENLQFNLVSDSWGELGEEICGGVVSMRSGEDVLSLWLRDANSGKNLKIRNLWAKFLELPANTIFTFISHDQALQNRNTQDENRKEKSAQHGQRTSLNRANSKVDYPSDKKQAS